jgi:hypothetical protein
MSCRSAGALSKVGAGVFYSENGKAEHQEWPISMHIAAPLTTCGFP